MELLNNILENKCLIILFKSELQKLIKKKSGNRSIIIITKMAH